MIAASSSPARRTDRIIHGALRLWPVVLAAAVLAAVLGFAWSSSRPKVYEASTTVQISDVDLASLFAGQFVQRPDSGQVLASNAKLVNIPRVREAASAALGGTPTADQLYDRISTKPETDTTLLVIKVTGDSPASATAAADAVRKAFIASRSEDARSQLDNARTLAEQELARLRSGGGDQAAQQQLRSRLDQLTSLRAVASGGVITVQTAREPKAAISPKPVRTAALAGILGLLLGSAAALARAYVDRRMRTADELSEIWDLPVLGLIPNDDSLTRGRTPSRVAAEAFSLTATNLRYANPSAQVHTIMVASATPGEGKSTTAWGLGVAAAASGMRVLLIDADLRRPTLGRRANVSGPGLSEVLAGMSRPAEAIQTIEVDWPGQLVSLDILAAGTVPPSPLALLQSEAASRLLEQAAEKYDLVLIDTPPATVVGDARVLLERVQGVIVVGRLERVDRDAFERLRDVFSASGTPVLGIAINGLPSRSAFQYGPVDERKRAN